MAFLVLNGDWNRSSNIDPQEIQILYLCPALFKYSLFLLLSATTPRQPNNASIHSSHILLMFRDKSLKNLFKVLGLLWISYPVYVGATPSVDQQQQSVSPAIFAIQQIPRLELSVLLGGSNIPNTISGQSLQLMPYEVGPYADTFIHQSDASAFTWGLDAKYRFMLHDLSSQNYIFDSFGAGIDVFQITDFHQTGDVLQFNMPEFENYTYNLQLKNTRVMLDLDLDFHPLLHYFIPFIEGGIGPSSTVITYNSAPIPPVDEPGFALASQTSWSFAYQVGAGIKYVVNTHFSLAFHYLYANMGKVNSSTTGSTTTLEKPLTVNMRTQNFMLGLTYTMQ
jgi:opacity protein-like surface antigen